MYDEGHRGEAEGDDEPDDRDDAVDVRPVIEQRVLAVGQVHRAEVEVGARHLDRRVKADRHKLEGAHLLEERL